MCWGGQCLPNEHVTVGQVQDEGKKSSCPRGFLQVMFHLKDWQTKWDLTKRKRECFCLIQTVGCSDEF